VPGFSPFTLFPPVQCVCLLFDATSRAAAMVRKRATFRRCRRQGRSAQPILPGPRRARLGLFCGDGAGRETVAGRPCPQTDSGHTSHPGRHSPSARRAIRFPATTGRRRERLSAATNKSSATGQRCPASGWLRHGSHPAQRDLGRRTRALVFGFRKTWSNHEGLAFGPGRSSLPERTLPFDVLFGPSCPLKYSVRWEGEAPAEPFPARKPTQAAQQELRPPILQRAASRCAWRFAKQRLESSRSGNDFAHELKRANIPLRLRRMPNHRHAGPTCRPAPLAGLF